MFRSWFPIAVALVAAPALFAAEVEVKPSATPAPARPKGSASPAPSSSVGVRPGTSPSAELPKYRPAVLPLGPDSVINRIDTAGLIRDGQKYWVISREWIKKNGYKWPDDVYQVSAEELERVPLGGVIE